MPPSNDPPLVEIARLCGEAASALSPLRALSAVLRSAATALGAERAYLVTREAAARHSPAVRASVSLRDDGIESPSSTTLRWALLETRPTFRLDLSEDPALASADSIRGMALRWVVAAPVPSRSSAAALVLDSRRPPALAHPVVEEILEAYAGIAGIVLASVLGYESSRPPREGVLPEADLIGSSPAFTALLRSIPRVAATRLPVLIVGESGAGKEAIARAIHAGSARAAAPLVAINCAAFAESLLESELFGATRGAYTGADRDRPGVFTLAHGGTLFLDEVGDMPLAMQGKVLRALQEGRIRPVGGAAEKSVDVRVVAATHRDLAALVSSGGFRSDLYYRLAVVELRVPPLRERQEDIPPLVEHLLRALEREHGLAPARPTSEALASLVSHPWPGNVRELHAVLARAVLRSQSGTIARRDLDLPSAPRDEAADAAAPESLEIRMLRATLRETGGNIAGAARKIGWTRQKLSRRLRALGIPRPG